MSRALIALAAAVAGYAIGRAIEYRAWLAACEAPLPDPADDVQPPDPRTWPDLFAEWDPWTRGMTATIATPFVPGLYELYESEPIRSTQTGPIGPAA